MLRDYWWLMALVGGVGVLMCYFVAVFVGLIVVGIGLFVPLYFASMRYDDSGRERQEP